MFLALEKDTLFISYIGQDTFYEPATLLLIKFGKSAAIASSGSGPNKYLSLILPIQQYQQVKITQISSYLTNDYYFIFKEPAMQRMMPTNRQIPTKLYYYQYSHFSFAATNRLLIICSLE
jgi:hypothetical protein